MPHEKTIYQRGSILHSAIIGAFKVQGSTFAQWCNANDVKHSIARQATYGQSAGPKSTALLGRIIQAAGAEQVEISYRYRMRIEAEALAEASTQAEAMAL